MNRPEEDEPPPPCLFIIAVALALWVIILFGITYAIHWLVN